MKKFFKSLSVICLALVLLFPLALVGCDKNHTITIEIVQGQGNGFVFLKDVEGVSVTGENAVNEGDKFEYYVVPAEGYQIAKVLIDGVEQTGYDKDGTYFSFDKVEKSHKVHVYFEAKVCVVTFYCVSAGNDFEVFKTVNINKGEQIDLNQASYGGAKALWYYKDGNKNVYFFNGLTTVTETVPEGYEDSNILFVHGDGKVYCNKTAADLIAMGVVR